MNSLPNLPAELIARIGDFVDSDTKRALSMINRRIRSVLLNAVKCVEVGPCKDLVTKKLKKPSVASKDILVNVIKRYSRLETIVFGSPRWCRGEFGHKEFLHLTALIAHFQSDSGQSRLSSIKKIKFQEIKHTTFTKDERLEAKRLNNTFLSSICHKGLESMTIKTRGMFSILSQDVIQQALEKAPNLKIFAFNGFQSAQRMNLSFAVQTKLLKAKFVGWLGTASTVTSLKACKQLKELVIVYRNWTDPDAEITGVLASDHPWNLKRLELGNLIVRNDAELDAITRRLPNLECLSINHLQKISDDGMKKIGHNCQKLKILKFGNQNLTNAGINRLTKHLSKLEMIDIDDAAYITNEGVASVARNCKKLQFIRFWAWFKVG